MEIPNTLEVLERYGNDVINSMRNILIINDKDATGNLINSLSYQVTYQNDVYDIEFEMADYGKYVEDGRQSGKYPPRNAIAQWASVKGIPNKAIFPIMKKIKDFGIKPTPFFQRSIDQYRPQFIIDLKEAYIKDVEKHLLENLQ